MNSSITLCGRLRRGQKYLALMLTLGLAAGLAACAPKSAGGQSTEAPASQTPSTSASTAAGQTAAPDSLSPFSGMPADAAARARRVLCVMLDNHPDARPQAGLRQADMVFEMKVEGNYTRYMALYQSQDPKLVGPVRSARDCFLDRMLEFKAVYVHFGASYTAAARIKSEGIQDLDGLALCGGAAIFRYNDTGKEAPHNAYAKPGELRKLVYNYAQTAPVQGYRFNAAPTALKTGGPAQKITLDFASDNSTGYHFDSASGFYGRVKDGKEDVDENDGKPLQVRNIVIQKAASRIMAAPLLKIEQIGEGTGFYVTMGKVEAIRWEKKDLDSLTRYYTQSGEEITLNPGQTWVEVVDPDTPLKFS